MRKDYIYLWGMPVAVLFSSPDVSTPECGRNFIVPNHLGTPMRLIDQNGLVTQSPEPWPCAIVKMDVTAISRPTAECSRFG